MNFKLKKKHFMLISSLKCVWWNVDVIDLGGVKSLTQAGGTSSLGSFWVY